MVPVVNKWHDKTAQKVLVLCAEVL